MTTMSSGRPLRGARRTRRRTALNPAKPAPTTTTRVTSRSSSRWTGSRTLDLPTSVDRCVIVAPGDALVSVGRGGLPDVPGDRLHLGADDQLAGHGGDGQQHGPA